MNWPMTSIENIAASSKYACVGGPFGSKLTGKDYVSEGVPVIRGANMGERFISNDDFVFVTESKVNKDLFGNLAHPGDVVFTQRGTLGQVSLVPENAKFDRYVVSQSQMKLTVDKNKADAKFIYYFFSSKETAKKILNYASSSGVPHINLTVLRNFEIPLPQLEQQKEIAKTLSNYDDLIENNKRRIELLEDSARQLYKEWFVRFRFPGHEHVRIIDGVPEGWKKGMVSQFYRTSSGGTPSRKIPEFYTGEINWVKTQELNNCFIFDTEEKITEEAISKSSAKLHPENSVLVAMYGATIGELGILAKPSTTNQACCALIANADTAHYTHAYLFLKENKTALIGMSKGAAQNNISQDIIKNMDMLMPPQTLLEQFVDIVDPMFLQIKTLSLQIEKLTSARDILLPKLMSGEIAV